MSVLSSIAGRIIRSATSASDWLRTFKILHSRDIPTAFYARKFQMQLVQTGDDRKYISFRIFGDEQETRATFTLEEAATLHSALGELIEAAKPARQS